MAGGRLALSRGTFDVTTAIPLDTYQQLVGMGKFATILKPGNSANCDVLCMSNDNTHRYGIGIRDLQIDGNKDNNTSGNGIVMYAVWYSVIDNVYIKNCSGKGIHYGDAGDAGQHAYITRVECNYNEGTGLHLEHGVTDSHIGPVWCYDNATVTGSQIILDTAGGTHAYHLHCGPSPVGGDSTMVIRGGMEHMTIHGLQIADDLEAANGLEIYAETAYVMYVRIDGGYIHNEAAGAHTGYGIYLRGTTATSKKVWRNQISGLYVDGYAYSCYIKDSKCEDNQITHNRFVNAAISPVYNAGTRTYFLDNYGYIAKGETRTSGGSLTQGAVSTVAFYWNNPEKQDILVRKVTTDVTTASTDTGACIDIGIADSSSGTNLGTEFFDDLPTDATGVNCANAMQLCEDSTSATDAYVVGLYVTEDSTKLVGTYSIEYQGR